VRYCTRACAMGDGSAFRIELQRVIFVVYPVFTLLFWFLYWRCWARVTRYLFGSRRARVIDGWSTLQHACFYANANSCLHACGVVILLCVMMATDSSLWTERLHPHRNNIGHAAMSFSLAYFSFAIPWQWRLFFCMGERDAVNLPMVMHHVIVVLGILLYLLSSVCAPYGAIAFVCMEFTNWMFVPFTMMSQLGMEGSTAHQVVGVMLVLSFVFCRIIICTWQAVKFTVDVSEFASDTGGEWAFVLMAYVVYLAALCLSWIWLKRVLLECHAGVKDLLIQIQKNRASVSPMRQDASHSRRIGIEGAPPQRTSVTSPTRTPSGV